MQTQSTEIAVRLYENSKLGSTYGKGLYHSAIFNGTADVPSHQVKYVLDFHPFTQWQHTAKSDMDMDTVHLVYENADDNTLVSWVLRYDTQTKRKERVIGFSTLDINSSQLELVIFDFAISLEQKWRLEAKPCRQVEGKKVPTLLAANYDMGYR